MTKQFTKKQIERIIGKKEVDAVDKAPVRFSDSKSNKSENLLDYELYSKVSCYDYMGCEVELYKYYRVPKEIARNEVLDWLDHCKYHYEIKNEKRRI